MPLPDRRMLPTTTKLLVSVRSLPEARAALEGGADVIDVKEPSRGSLGMADPEVLEAIQQEVRGQRPISAALGELREPNISRPFEILSRFDYLKTGLAGVTNPEEVRTSLVLPATAQAVLVAYADYPEAVSLEPEILAGLAGPLGFQIMLIDTFRKDGSTLLDWMTAAAIEDLRERLSREGISLALAGSLGAMEIQRLLPVRPAWFAVRGAACEGGRQGTVCPERVRGLKQLLVAG